jgi:predicted component of type VI protein secretion system
MEQPWTIGRKPGDNTICIRGDKTVSSMHCRLEVYNDRLFLIDLGSKNRTYYKPKRTKKNKAWYLPQKGSQPLTSGDVFYVGYTCFEVVVYDSNFGLV